MFWLLNLAPYQLSTSLHPALYLALFPFCRYRAPSMAEVRARRSPSDRQTSRAVPYRAVSAALYPLSPHATALIHRARAERDIRGARAMSATYAVHTNVAQRVTYVTQCKRKRRRAVRNRFTGWMEVGSRLDSRGRGLQMEQRAEGCGVFTVNMCEES